jgi:hypothetical protein
MSTRATASSTVPTGGMIGRVSKRDRAVAHVIGRHKRRGTIKRPTPVLIPWSIASDRTARSTRFESGSPFHTTSLDDIHVHPTNLLSI